jgi:hypothetical protein
MNHEKCPEFAFSPIAENTLGSRSGKGEKSGATQEAKITPARHAKYGFIVSL